MEKKKRDKSNGGYSLFSVILAISFVAMLLLAAMYLSLVNFRMRQTELKTKDSFYSAEQALEEIRTGLQQIEGDSLANAYIRVLESYSITNTTNTVEERNTKFKELFLENVVTTVVDPIKDTSSLTFNYYDLDLLKGFVKTNRLKEGETLTVKAVPGEQLLTGSMDNGVLLRGIQVTFVDARGRTSVIRSDIRLGVPAVNFVQASDLPDLLNMTLIAEDGLTALGKSTIQGSLYAGTGTDKEPGAAFGIYVQPSGELTMSGEQIVTNGTVYADTLSKLVCKENSSLWARNVYVKSSDVSLLGKTYLSDDLTIDTAVGNRAAEGDEAYIGGNTVKLGGEFYGYGSADTYAGNQASAQLTDLYKDTSKADKESAVLINGKNTTLDMSGLTKLMLVGKSYIHSDKKEGESTFKDLSMGESLTVKNNQLAYLVPSQCLFTGEQNYSNPMSFDTYKNGLASIGTADSSGKAITEYNLEVPLQKLNGKTLKSMGVTDVSKLFVQESSMVYYYMAFDNTQSAAKFFQEYYGDAVLKEQLDQYASFYLNKDNGIKLGKPDSYLRYVTKGNTFSYADGEGTVTKPQYSDDSGTLEQEQKNYQDVYYALNKKMVNNYDSLKVHDSGRDEADKDSYVFGNMIDLSTMNNFIAANSSNGIYEFTGKSTASRALIVDNQSSDFGGTDKVFEVDASMGEGGTNPVSILICNGPVVVKSDVKYKGVILTNSTLTLENGANILSDSDSVSKVFQNNRNKDGNSTPMIGEKNASPMNFFWDSSQYLLSSSGSGGNVDDVKDAFNLSKLITYENWEKN